jgi:hypothetical protein
VTRCQRCGIGTKRRTRVVVRGTGGRSIYACRACASILRTPGYQYALDVNRRPHGSDDPCAT